MNKNIKKILLLIPLIIADIWLVILKSGEKATEMNLSPSHASSVASMIFAFIFVYGLASAIFYFRMK